MFMSAAVCGKHKTTFHSTASHVRLAPVACHLGLGIILWFTTIVAYDIDRNQLTRLSKDTAHRKYARTHTQPKASTDSKADSCLRVHV